MAEILTISGLRNLVAKKSTGEEINEYEIKLIEEYMLRLSFHVENEHKNCCCECVTVAVWHEALISYEFITGERYG